jgi:hypothetical protein
MLSVIIIRNIYYKVKRKIKNILPTRRIDKIFPPLVDPDDHSLRGMLERKLRGLNSTEGNREVAQASRKQGSQRS